MVLKNSSHGNNKKASMFRRTTCTASKNNKNNRLCARRSSPVSSSWNSQSHFQNFSTIATTAASSLREGGKRIVTTKTSNKKNSAGNCSSVVSSSRRTKSTTVLPSPPTTTITSDSASAAASGGGRSSTLNTTSSSSSSSASTTTAAAAASPSSASAPTIRTNVLPWEWVSSTKIQQSLPYIGHGAYLALVSGFCMTDMLQLRCALVGGYTGLVAFHSLHMKPLQIPLRWSAVFVLVNAGAAVLLAMDRFGAPLSEEELELYQTQFPNLTPGQFHTLLKLSKTEYVEDETILTQEGKVCPKLYFLYKGKAKVFHNEQYAANIDQGGFVNDIAFQQSQQNAKLIPTVMTSDKSSATTTTTTTNSMEDSPFDAPISKGRKKQNNNNNNNNNKVTSASSASLDTAHSNVVGGAYGTVVTHGDCTFLVWDAKELKAKLSKNSDFQRNFQHTLSDHLMRALLKQREARYAKENRNNKVMLRRAITKHQLLESTSSSSTKTEATMN